MQPVNTAADFNKLAAEAKGSTLLRIMLDGQGMFIVVCHGLEANGGKSAVREPVVSPLFFASRHTVFLCQRRNCHEYHNYCSINTTQEIFGMDHCA
jgi:hypothetical protein